MRPPSVTVDLDRKTLEVHLLKHQDIEIDRLTLSLDGVDDRAMLESLSPGQLAKGERPSLNWLTQARMEVRECGVHVGATTQAALRKLAGTHLQDLPPALTRTLETSLEGELGLHAHLAIRREASQPGPQSPFLSFQNDVIVARGFGCPDGVSLNNLEIRLPGADQRIGVVLSDLFSNKPPESVLDQLTDQPIGVRSADLDFAPAMQARLRATAAESLKTAPPIVAQVIANALGANDPNPDNHLRLALGLSPHREELSELSQQPPEEMKRGFKIDMENGVVTVKGVQTGDLSLDHIELHAPDGAARLADALSLEKLLLGEKLSFDGLKEMPLKTGKVEMSVGPETIAGLQKAFLRSRSLKQLKITPTEDGHLEFEGRADKLGMLIDFDGRGYLDVDKKGDLMMRVDELSAGWIPGVNTFRGFLLDLMKPDVPGVEVVDSTIRFNPDAMLPEGIDITIDRITTRDGRIYVEADGPQKKA